MDPQYFDALTRRLSHAGSRRRVLTALAVSAFGQIVDLSRADRVAASCKSGSACPPEKPCCIKGKCREKCGDDDLGNPRCCPDCFVVVLPTGNPDEDHPVCCTSSGGTMCEHKKPGPADDRCCYDDEVCLKGKCCWVGFAGATNCGGKCCATEACCNGKCCEKGYVCATKEEGAGETCVRANRDCDDDECFPGETCHGGTCCSGLRECNNGAGKEFCCKAREYCVFKGSGAARCCPINTSCSTYRGQRVRR